MKKKVWNIFERIIKIIMDILRSGGIMFRMKQKGKDSIHMTSLILHLILPMFFYTGVSDFLFLNLNIGALNAAALSSVICAPFLYFVYLRDQKLRSITPAINLKLHGCFFYILLFGAALCMFGNEIVAMSGLDHISPAYEEAKNAIYSPTIPAQIAAAGFLIPFTEELIFRGLCFAALRDRLSFLPSAILSAALFGIYHGNLPQGVYAFIIGLAVAWLYEVTQTLLAPFILHMMANLMSLLVTNTTLGNLLSGSNNQSVMAVIAILSFIVSLLCIIRIYRKNKLKEDMV
jgi:membrane protease YdiL (CAAX protease family)